MLICCHQPMPGWLGIFTMLRTLCQIKSFSDPGSEPLLVCNCSARRTMAAKAWRQMKSKFILYACRRGLEQRRIMRICQREKKSKQDLNELLFLAYTG
ncbi:hypothetical protein T08_15600 [Trichinella sp. T8]|nr:hypothetical protein T08_15600 [Trichinella sp. T8]